MAVKKVRLFPGTVVRTDNGELITLKRPTSLIYSTFAQGDRTEFPPEDPGRRCVGDANGLMGRLRVPTKDRRGELDKVVTVLED